MFDANSKKSNRTSFRARKRSQNGNAERDRIHLTRRNNSKANAPPIPTQNNNDALDLIVFWDRSLAELRQALDAISDWGPFELTLTEPLTGGRARKRKIRCRFDYHGPMASRDQFERNLKALLREVAYWEDFEPPEYAA